MARIVSEVMNSEVFHLRTDDDVDHALVYLDGLGISGAPVLERTGQLVGVISLKDLIRRGPATVGERMGRPAVAVRAQESLHDAAVVLAERGFRRLPVVDDDGTLVGVASALDVLRGLLGIPAAHPDSFPHYDRATGLNWSDDRRLALDQIAAAPNGPGIVMLRVGGVNMSERTVWSEAASNLRARLRSILSDPQDNPALRRLLERYTGQLRFRFASVPDAVRRHEALSGGQQH